MKHRNLIYLIQPIDMKTTPTSATRRLGLRLLSHARALLAFSVLAAFAASTRVLAQLPTFNALALTPVNVGSGFPEDAAVGDINGDGKPDVMIAGIGGLRVLLGNGDGTFVDRLFAIPDVTISNVVNLHPTLVSSVTANPAPVGGIGGIGGGIKAVDVNRDGKLDLVCVTTVGINFTNYSFVSVLINTGVNDANGVPLFTTTHHWIPFLGVRPVTVGDLNGDGWPDFIVGTGGGSLMVWTSNGGTGTFTPGQATSLVPNGNSSTGPGAIVDVNGDGKADFVVTSGQAGATDIFYGNGDGTLQAPSTILPNNAVLQGSPASVVVADVNGDGRPDLLISNVGTGGDGLRVYLNNGGGVFGAPTLYAIPGFASSFSGGCSIVVADLNGDGKLDAVLSNTNSNALVVMLGDGNGGFGAPGTYSASVFPTWLFVGDFNSDGKADIGFDLRNSRAFGVLMNTTVPVAPPVVASDTRSPGYGQPFSYQISATNAPGGYGATGLPTGLNVNPGTGLISGTPTQSGSFTVDLSATNGGGTGHGTLSLTIAPLVTQTLTILGGSGNIGDVAANVEYFNPATGLWQPAYLANYAPYGHPFTHPWGNITGTNHWINYKVDGGSDAGAGPTINQTLFYLYRVRFTIPSDAINPQMTFSVKADNVVQVAINGVTTGGATMVINNTTMNNVVDGQADQLNADAVFSQAIHPGENTITLNVGDYGGLNGFNFRIDLSMLASQPPVIVTPPAVAAPVVASASANGTFGTAFSYQISATNAPASYGATSLPSGLSVNASGLISGTPTQVGSFSVGLSATNAGGTGTGTLTLSVSKKTATITLADLSYTYDGTAKSATATTNPSGLSVTFNAGNSFTNAGTYPIIASIADDNYTGSASADLVINKAAATIAVTPYSVTYDGAAHSAIVAITGVNGESGSTVGSVTLNSTHTDAGTYSDSWSFAGAANYNSIASTTFTDKIAKADATVTVTGYTGIYDGATHGATGSATGVGGVNLTGALSLGASFKNAPGGTASWTFAGGTNYNDVSGSAAIVINKATATVAVTPYTVEFDGQPHAATVASITGVNGETGATVGAVTLNSTHTTVGTYPSDSWSFAGTNYNNLSGTITDTIKDTTAPIITAPANLIVEATSAAGATVTYSASVFDLVGATLTTSKASGSVFPLGTTTVILTAADAAGNAATPKTFTVTVRDTTGPVITAPNIVAEATSDEGARVNFTVTALDAVSGARPVTVNRSSGSKFPLGVTTVTATATDAAGNKTTVTFTITVRDTTAPTLKLPKNIVACATSAAGAIVRYDVDADDAVSNGNREITFTYSKASGSTFPLGVTVVTVTAKDQAGNISTGTFTVTVKDTVRPVFTTLSVNPSKILTNDHSMVNVTVTALATDKVDPSLNVRIVSVTSDEAITGTGTGDVGPDWVITGPLTLQLRAERDPKANGRIYTITVAATDDSGNTVTRTLHVLVPKTSSTRFEDCDDHHRSESQRCDDEDRDNDGHSQGDRDDDDDNDNDHRCRGW